MKAQDRRNGEAEMNQGQARSAENRLVPRTAPMEGEASFAHVAAAIARLGAVIDAETELLSNGQPIDLRDITARKSRGLYDLSRALRQIEAPAERRVLEEPMRGLRESLERNEAVLANHLRAVGEIAEILRKAVEMDEADGTYSIGRPYGPAL